MYNNDNNNSFKGSFGTIILLVLQYILQEKFIMFEISLLWSNTETPTGGESPHPSPSPENALSSPPQLQIKQFGFVFSNAYLKVQRSLGSLLWIGSHLYLRVILLKTML